MHAVHLIHVTQEIGNLEFYLRWLNHFLLVPITFLFPKSRVSWFNQFNPIFVDEIPVFVGENNFALVQSTVLLVQSTLELVKSVFYSC